MTEQPKRCSRKSWQHPSPPPPTQAVEELIRLKAQAKQDKELILQLVETLASVDAAMPFPVARQVLKVARARLERMHGIKGGQP